MCVQNKYWKVFIKVKKQDKGIKLTVPCGVAIVDIKESVEVAT